MPQSAEAQATERASAEELVPTGRNEARQRRARWSPVAAALAVLLGAAGHLAAQCSTAQCPTAQCPVDSPPAGPRRGADVEAQRWSILPVAGYSTETTLFVGGMAVHYPPSSPDARGSSVPAVGFGSIKGQYQVLVAPDLYLAGDALHLEATAVLQKWPASYYERGNDSGSAALDYEADGIALDLSAQRRLGPPGTAGGHLRAGPRVSLAWDRISWQGKTIEPMVKGANGGVQIGVGLAASHDTRDVPAAPACGHYASYSLRWHRSWMGGDYNYTVHRLEARHYRGLGPRRGGRRVLALGADLQLVGGGPPFREWSSPDGVRQLRGIENGRYRDTHLVSLQVEYRHPLDRRVGMVAFCDAAQVFPRLDALSLSSLHVAPGLGLRFTLNPAQRFNLRLDGAWVDGGPGIAITAGEAF